MASLDLEFAKKEQLGITEMCKVINDPLIDKLDVVIERHRARLWIHYTQDFKNIHDGEFMIERGYNIYQNGKLVCRLDTGNGMRKIFLSSALRVDHWDPKKKCWYQVAWYKP